MKKNPIKSNTYKTNPDGTFSVEIDPNAEEESPAPPLGIPVFGNTANMKDVNVQVTVAAAPGGGSDGSLKAMSNVGIAETLTSIVRVLIELVYAMAAVYGLNVDDLMNKVRSLIDSEFYSKYKKDG